MALTRRAHLIFNHTALLMMLCVGLLSGCGGGATVPQSYAGSARYNYELGAVALEDGDYLEAIRQFTFVKNKYPYSKYAALAELRIADAYYEQDKFNEAIQAYGTFIEGRPNHEKVDYAMWRRAASFFEQLPSDFFLFPPAHEKDQRSTQEALRALQKFVDRFPKSDAVPAAQERIRACRSMLADHELYVARFYLRDERPQSAVSRLEAVVTGYKELPDRWSEAAYMLARTYEVLDRREEAVRTAEDLIKSYPDRPEAEDAQDFISGLR